jgi:hypothetical protein
MQPIHLFPISPREHRSGPWARMFPPSRSYRDTRVLPPLPQDCPRLAGRRRITDALSPLVTLQGRVPQAGGKPAPPALQAGVLGYWSFRLVGNAGVEPATTQFQAEDATATPDPDMWAAQILRRALRSFHLSC